MARHRFCRSEFWLRLITLSLVNIQGIGAALALPEYQGAGSHGVSGLVSGSNAQISVEAQRAFVRWKGFNVDSGETFKINGNPSQTILNLVTGADPSRIAGMVDSGARFILANPNGISLLKGGQIIAPSALLTTARFNPDEWLKGATDMAGAISASGYLSFDPGSAINLEGTIHATADAHGVGGSIRLLADQLNLGPTVVLTATGPNGGGEILVGGSWQNSQPELGQATQVTIEKGALLDASATDQGKGGTIVAWSDIKNPASRTEVYGSLYARGGINGGDGGRIETSGYFLDVEGVQGDARSFSGANGLWLFDPASIQISSGANNGSLTGAVVTDGTIENLLNSGTSVTLDTGTGAATAGTNAGHEIKFDAGVSIDKTSGGDAVLTFKSEGRIWAGSAGGVANTYSIQSSSGALDVVLWSNSSGNNDAGVVVGSITTNGGDLWVGGGSGSVTWNGLTVGNSYAAGNGAAGNQNAIDINGAISTAGGDVYLAGKQL